MKPLIKLWRWNQQHKRQWSDGGGQPQKSSLKLKRTERTDRQNDNHGTQKRHSKVDLLQVTTPICVLGIFAISCWTAIHLENGSLVVELEVSQRSRRVKVNITKGNLAPTTTFEKPSESY